MLLWALGILDQVPSYGSDFAKDQVFQSPGIVPSVSESVTGFINHFKSTPRESLSLVSETSFKTQVDIAEAWYWRAKAQRVLELKKSLKDNPEQRGKIPKALKLVMENIDKAITLGSQRALSDGLIPTLIDGDFPVGGLAYKGLNDHQLRDLDGRIEARLASLAWMTGREEWDVEKGNVTFINPMGSLWSPE